MILTKIMTAISYFSPVTTFRFGRVSRFGRVKVRIRIRLTVKEVAVRI